VVASPESGSCWVLWICVCLWFIRALKMFEPCPNQLVDGLYRSMRIIDPHVICPTPHLGTPTRHSTPEVLWAKKRTSTPSFSLFSFSDLHLNLSRSVGCVTIKYNQATHQLHKHWCHWTSMTWNVEIKSMHFSWFVQKVCSKIVL
jgi:hypothetical protein